MHMQRTGGMTAIGILNIIGGGIGSLVAIFVVLLGGLFAAAGAGIESQASGEAQGAGTMVAAGGGLIMVMGLIGLAAWAMLMISGIGVLKMKSWGRTLSMICGGVLVLLNLFSLVNGFNILSLAFLCYGGMLIAMFMQPAWRAAFCSSGSVAGSIDNSMNDQFRAAA